MPLKQNTTHYRQKGDIISRYQTTNLLKIWFLFLNPTKERKVNKNKFVSRIVEITVAIILK